MKIIKIKFKFYFKILEIFSNIILVLIEFIYLFIQDIILLYPNLSVYVCKTLFLETWTLTLDPHTPQALWSDHRTKDVQW